MSWTCSGTIENGQKGCGEINDDFDSICISCGLSKNDFEHSTLEISPETEKINIDGGENTRNSFGKVILFSTIGVMLFFGLGFVTVNTFGRTFNLEESPIEEPQNDSSEVTKLSQPHNSQTTMNRNTIGQPKQFITHTDEKHAIQISYPEDWGLNSVEDKIRGQIAHFSPNLNPNNPDHNNGDVSVLIYAEKLPNPMTLNQYSELIINDISQNFNQEIKESNVILANKDARQISLTITGENDLIKLTSIWTLDNYTAYKIIYQAQEQDFTEYEPVVNQMIKSFQFTQTR